MLNGKTSNGVMIAAVPSLDEISANPTRAIGLPPAAIRMLLLRAAIVQSALAVALETPAPVAQPQPSPAADERMLTPKEAAQLLRRSPRWIYRNAERLPFVKRVSAKTILCSEAGIKQWLTARGLN